MIKPVIYIFINKSLHMSAGKIAAQAAHAALTCVLGLRQQDTNQWTNNPHRYVIILEARSAEHLYSIQSYLGQREIRSVEVIDEGKNEIDAHVPTALVTEIMDKDDEKVQLTMSTFDKYHDDIKVTLEIPR